MAEPLPTPSLSSSAEAITTPQLRIPLAKGLPAIPPPDVPGYELLGELGRGGMGVVYKARQTALNRLVALKVIRADRRAGPDMIQRFLAEAEAVAAVRHPNVVQIHEAGTHAGQPYFTLELVAGGSLSARLARQPLAPAEAAHLVEQIARGVQAVHERGVIHRDLKPANILLDIPDNAPADAGLNEVVPKVTDFGLARRLEGPNLTLSGAVMGTPSYMSPEQASSKGREVGPATDVYALGAILYECLTGRPPFHGSSMADILIAVHSEEPVRPSRLTLKLPRDLETICLKCLAKEPGRRYASAGDLADDLGRYRRGEPVRARPVSRWERTARWARRHPTVAALLAAVVVVTVVGATGMAWAYNEAVRQRGEAQVQRDVAVREKGRADAEADAQASARRDADEARGQVELRNIAQRKALAISHTLLSDAARDADDLERAWEWLQGVPVDLRSFDWYVRCRRLQNGLFTLYGHDDIVHCVAYSPDGRLLATGSRDGTARLWDARTGHPLLVLPHPSPVEGLAFSPDGGRLATLAKGVVRVRDTATGQERFTLPRQALPAAWVLFNPDGRTLATGHLAGVVIAIPNQPTGTIQLWEARTGQPTRTLTDVGEVRVALFSPDGRRLALSGDWLGAGRQQVGGVRVWDVAANKPLFAIPGSPFGLDAGLFLPDGRQLLVVSPRGEARLYDAASGMLVRDLPARLVPSSVSTAPAPPGRVVLSPDGQYLAVPDPTALRVFDLASGRTQAVLRGHLFPVTAVSFHPGGRLLASASGDGSVRVWDLANDPERLVVRAHERGAYAVAIAADGRLASGGADRVVRLWDAEGRPLRDIVGHSVPILAVAFSPDGTRLASAAGPPMGEKKPGEARVWDLATGRELFPLAGHDAVVTAIAWDATGRLLATASLDGTVRLWQADTGQPVRQFDLGGEGLGLSFAVDGKRLAAATSVPGGKQGLVLVWDVATGRELLRRAVAGTGVRGVCFSPDGKTLALATLSMAVSLLDAETGADLWWVQQNGLVASGLAFTPDGRRLAAATGLGELRLWDVATGQELLVERGQRASNRSLAFSTDGRRAATATAAGDLVVWDVRLGPEVRVLRGQPGVVNSLAFSPDGQRLATRGGDNVRLWDAETGQPRPGKPDFPLPPDVNWPRAFSPDHSHLALSRGYTVLLTDLPSVTAREEALRRWATAPQLAWHRQEAARLRQSRPTEAALHQALAGGVPAASVASFRRGLALAGAGDPAAGGAFLLALAEARSP
jgi:eukaryotic-like serine/threonine-protein kinase